MGKPEHAVYERFRHAYARMNEQLGKDQYLVPYLMSSHPGSGLREAVELAEYCRDLGYMPEQVQDFYPTPSTMSTVMYFTGVDPRTMKRVYVPKDAHEKALQRARSSSTAILLTTSWWWRPCVRAHRSDLIGYGPECLVRPHPPKARTGGERGGWQAAAFASWQESHHGQRNEQTTGRARAAGCWLGSPGRLATEKGRTSASGRASGPSGARACGRSRER